MTIAALPSISESAVEFLEKLARIQDIPRLSSAQQETAERFAYGVFILRPFSMKTISLEFNNPKTYRGDCLFNIQKKEDWFTAPDIRSFIDWVTASTDEDYLSPLPGDETIE